MYLMKTYSKRKNINKKIRYLIIFLPPHWIVLNTSERSLLWPIGVMEGC